MNSGVDYEFRTTLVKEFHTLEDVKSMALLVEGSKNYALQQYKNPTTDDGYTPYTKAEMTEMKHTLEHDYGIDRVIVRAGY